jgi:glutathione S-transferase
LEHNGKQVGQSLSIARYVANLVKLAGKDTWENLEIDAVVDTINDLRLSKKNALLGITYKVFSQN